VQLPCLARQPILDRRLRLVAYELLFRDPGSGGVHPPLGDQATARVIVDTLMQVDTESVLGDARGLVNVTREFVLSDLPRLLPPERFSLELLESARIDGDLLEALGRLRNDGYALVLDDFVYRPDLDPVLELAESVKIEVHRRTRPEIEAVLATVARHDIRLIAEKVETPEQYDLCQELGFDAFQGYFFAKPKLVGGATVEVSMLTKLRLAVALQQPGLDLKDFERIIASDVALSYRLLRYLNSAFCSFPRKLNSVREAVVMTGLDPMRRWATLVVLAGVEGKSQELLAIALIRAKMCETLAGSIGRDADGYFITGLFSVLDALADTPLETVVRLLPLSDEIVEALLAGEGPLGDTLLRVMAYERGDFEIAIAPPFDVSSISNAYVDAVTWASATLNELR
jgi:EAL and modified HD-GYP domain-containing signal transduction protein